MPQGPLPVFQQYAGGKSSFLNLTAATLIKATNGALYNAIINTAGTGGTFTLNDANALVTAQTITGITVATAAVVTLSTGGASNPFAVGNTIGFTSVGGMTQINTVVGQVTAIGGVTTAWTVTTNINSSAFTAWSSGGTAASYSAQNQIWTLPFASTALTLAGTRFGFEGWPLQYGLLLSAVQSGGGVLSGSFA